MAPPAAGLPAPAPPPALLCVRWRLMVVRGLWPICAGDAASMFDMAGVWGMPLALDKVRLETPEMPEMEDRERICWS